MQQRRKLSKWLSILISVFFSNYCTGACTVSVTPVNFGNYNVYSSTDLNAVGQVRVTCNPLATYVISLNGGINGNIAQRKLKLTTGSDLMFYNLYTDAARSVLWGDGTSNGVTVTASSINPITVYGRVAASQDLTVGLYTDTVTVTVDY